MCCAYNKDLYTINTEAHDALEGIQKMSDMMHALSQAIELCVDEQTKQCIFMKAFELLKTKKDLK